MATTTNITAKSQHLAPTNFHVTVDSGTTVQFGWADPSGATASVTFWYGALLSALNVDKTHITAYAASSRLRDRDQQFRDALIEAFNGGHISKSRANEMLEGLGIDPIPNQYRVEVTTSGGSRIATLTVTALDESEAIQQADEAITCTQNQTATVEIEVAIETSDEVVVEDAESTFDFDIEDDFSDAASETLSFNAHLID